MLVLAGAALGALGVYGVIVLRGAPDDEAPTTAPAAAPNSGTLALDAATLAHAGIRLAPLAAALEQGRQPGYARAVDLGPLAAIAAEVASASAAASASAREETRLVALARADAGAAAKDVEAARAQARGDAARLTLACRRVAFEYGPGLARLGCNALEGLAQQAAQGRIAILRLDFPGGAPRAGTVATVDLAPGMAPVRVLGAAAAGDTQLQSPGVLGLLAGEPATRVGVGRILAAHVPGGSPRTGVIVPREAIVRADSGLFAWRAVAPDRFERVPLDGAAAEAAGWFVPASRLHPGDRVVVSGAGTLLGLEHAVPAAAAGSDD
jgi:hypothetical protein